jgi:large subunit ribosomal protein L15
VGRHKHLWSYVTTHEPDYFGKHGFTSPRSLKQKERTLNLEKLEELSQKHPSEEGKSRVDLTSLGYTKLLGAGRITKPVIVSVAAFSKAAAEKIKEAGGEIVPVS